MATKMKIPSKNLQKKVKMGSKQVNGHTYATKTVNNLAVRVFCLLLSKVQHMYHINYPFILKIKNQPRPPISIV